MRLLLDTCVFLWTASGDAKVSQAARQAIAARDNDVFLSAVSVAEIAVKYRRGQLPLPEPPDRLIPVVRRQHGIAGLALGEAAALALARLPDLHQDPFDRLLIAQAVAHGLVLVTPDEAIRRYPVPTLW
ncbi:MAG: type II toxin-antitoxin system VapC family toxin [Terriglobales bacterium]